MISNNHSVASLGELLTICPDMGREIANYCDIKTLHVLSKVDNRWRNIVDKSYGLNRLQQELDEKKVEAIVKQLKVTAKERSQEVEKTRQQLDRLIGYKSLVSPYTITAALAASLVSIAAGVSQRVGIGSIALPGVMGLVALWKIDQADYQGRLKFGVAKDAYEQAYRRIGRYDRLDVDSMRPFGQLSARSVKEWADFLLNQ